MSNILKITFNASTIDGIIVKDMNYTPSMSQPQLYNGFPNIVFIPTIKLSDNLLEDNAVFLFDKKTITKNDKKNLFLSTSQLKNFLERLQSKKMYKPITLEESKKKGIIYNNIKFILDLFFSKGNKFHINQTTYLINNYDWNNHYDTAVADSMMTPIYHITINLTLHDGSELSFTDSTRLNCLQKRNSIINDYYELVGLDKPPEKKAPLNKQSINMSPNPPINIPVAYAVPLANASPIYKGGKSKRSNKSRYLRKGCVKRPKSRKKTTRTI